MLSWIKKYGKIALIGAAAYNASRITSLARPALNALRGGRKRKKKKVVKRKVRKVVKRRKRMK